MNLAHPESLKEISPKLCVGQVHKKLNLTITLYPFFWHGGLTQGRPDLKFADHMKKGCPIGCAIDLCIHGLDTENPAMTTTALKVNAYNSRVSSPTTSIFSPPHSPIHWKWWGSSAEPMRCNGGAPARGAWEMFVKMAWQYLGNGLTEWVQIWHTARYYTPANNACPNFEVPMHVRTCTPLFCISETTRPISLKFCIRQQPNNHCWFTPQARGATARAHVHTPCSYLGN